MATHAGMSIEEFDAIVSQWIATARHPFTKHLYTEMVYQPKHIGRRPIAAFGNSDGDLQMLQWTCGRGAVHLCLYVHHTDAAHECKYDHLTSVGELDKGFEQAAISGWTILSMKDDWRTIYPPAK